MDLKGFALTTSTTDSIMTLQIHQSIVHQFEDPPPHR